MNNIDCDYLRDFIDDNTDIGLLYVIKQEKGTCDEMHEFITEMHLMPKFLLYSHMRDTLGD